MSTNQPPSDLQIPKWRAAGLRYYGYNLFLRNKFGFRVQKVSIDAGFTCPNVDGTVAKGGCSFCDNRSFSPSRRLPKANIHGQIDQSIVRMKKRYKNCKHYLAYFQPATNTYAPVEKLRPLYEQALSHPDVVGLAIGTRSDCVGPDVMDLLSEIAETTYLAVEYGMQTMHNRTLAWMNRGEEHSSFLDAIERSRGRGFEICAHMILGLPDESHDDMLATAHELARLKIDSIKIHNLYAVKHTKLASEVESGKVTLINFEDYVQTVVDCLEVLPPTVIVERISGDAPPDYFIGPEWCLKKPAIKLAIEQELARRDSWQGKKYVESFE